MNRRAEQIEEPHVAAAGYAAARAHVDALCLRAGRPVGDVRVIAVSKGHGPSAVRAAYRAGARAFGESYLQDWRDKRALREELPGLEWHWIGHLQSNKVKEVAAHTTAIHSVDRRKLIDALAATQYAGDVYLQVNVSGEEAKSGCSVEEAPDLLDHACALGLRVAGWMGMAPVEGAPDAAFEQLAALRDRLMVCSPEARRLSIGMSGDMDAAIRLGATDVRIGTAIFGARPTGDA